MAFQPRTTRSPFATPSALDGAAPVGKLTSLDAMGQVVVALLRGQGGGMGADIEKVYAQMMLVFERHARRPVMHHGPSCECLGADEAVMAQFVRLAALGAREDATLMAMLLLRADIAPLAVSMAEQLGLLIEAVLRTDPRLTIPPTAQIH